MKVSYTKLEHNIVDSELNLTFFVFVVFFNDFLFHILFIFAHLPRDHSHNIMHKIVINQN